MKKKRMKGFHSVPQFKFPPLCLCRRDEKERERERERERVLRAPMQFFGRRLISLFSLSLSFPNSAGSFDVKPIIRLFLLSPSLVVSSFYGCRRLIEREKELWKMGSHYPGRAGIDRTGHTNSIIDSGGDCKEGTNYQLLDT